MIRAKGGILDLALVAAMIGLVLAAAPFPNSAGAEVSVIETTAVLDLEVQTNIQTSAVSPVVRQNFEPGEDVEVTAEFDVSANVPRVRLQVAITDLHFVRDPQNVSPIPLDRTRGVDINSVGASVIGGDNNANLTTEQDTIDGFVAYKSEELTFQTDEGGHTFDHRIFITARWDNRSRDYPAGAYEGRVKLICAVEPP